MGTITPMRRKPVTRPAAPAFAGIPPEAREAFASLAGSFNALARIYSGSFTTAAQAPEIERLTAAIEAGARQVRRLSR